jgi:hypothetical protein
VAHPAPAGEPLSEDFELTAGGQKVSVYVCRVSAMPFNQVWPGYQRPVDQTELASFATWDMTGPVDVEVVSRRPVETVAIRPTARGIQAKVDGNRIRFRLPSPQQIIVEVNGWHKALHLFANATDAAATNPQTPGVRYFGPGVHRPGMIHVESNQTVYIADGAVVYGAIEAKDASNFKILGRGIIDSSEIPRTTNRGDNHYARIKNVVQAGGCLRLVRCKNATIEGVILRDPNVWCLTTFLSSDIAISNVKLIGLWRYNADGIDICNSRRVTVRNCFVRAFDDSLVVKGLVSFADVPIHDILFEGCVVWNDWGRALEIGAETSSPELTRVTFRDCDVVRTAEIALDVQHSDRAPVSKVLFENIRFEVDDVNLAPRIQKTPDDKYVENTQFCPQFLVLVVVKSGNSHDAERGTMADVVVRDCSISGKPLPLSRLQGFDAQHDIRNVTISNLRINGRVATSLEDAGVRVGKFVQDVRIGSQ